MRFPTEGLNLHLTALSTRLSSGFLLGSLVEERMPVPQLLAKVFLWEPRRRTAQSGSHRGKYTEFNHAVKIESNIKS